MQLCEGKRMPALKGCMRHTLLCAETSLSTVLLVASHPAPFHLHALHKHVLCVC